MPRSMQDTCSRDDRNRTCLTTLPRNAQTEQPRSAPWTKLLGDQEKAEVLAIWRIVLACRPKLAWGTAQTRHR